MPSEVKSQKNFRKARNIPNEKEIVLLSFIESEIQICMLNHCSEITVLLKLRKILTSTLPSGLIQANRFYMEANPGSGQLPGTFMLSDSISF